MADLKKIQIYLGIAGAAGGLVAVILYFENRDKRKLDKEIAMNELQIKRLELAQKQDRARQFGTT
jgi:hypothetical protein